MTFKTFCIAVILVFIFSFLNFLSTTCGLLFVEGYIEGVKEVQSSVK